MSIFLLRYLSKSWRDKENDITNKIKNKEKPIIIKENIWKTKKALVKHRKAYQKLRKPKENQGKHAEN